MPLREPGLISHGLCVWPPLPHLRVPLAELLQKNKKISDWCLTAHVMFVKVCQVTARETNLQILFKRLTKRNFKKCLTQAKRFANIYKLSRDESTTNLENQRSINTQTLKILKNFQRPAMVKRSRDRANLFAVKQRTEQS